MAHPHARLTPVTRLELVGEGERGGSQAEVARQFRVSRPTVRKWVRRYRAEGLAGLWDRAAAPAHSPRRTPSGVARRVCTLRRRTGWDPHRLAWALGMARSTVYAVLRRAGLHRLDRLHRVTRRVVRYEHPRAGDLLHLDVKKLGRIPPGGGKRFAPGFAETGAGPSRGRAGTDALHVAIDDHSRDAYVAALGDERGPPAAGFLERALAHCRQQGVRVRGLLTDNGGGYRSHAFAAVVARHGLTHRFTRPDRPPRPPARPSASSASCKTNGLRAPLPLPGRAPAAAARFLAADNHQRPHGGIGGAVPASRL